MTRGFRDFAVIDWSGQAVERPKGLALAQAGRGTGAPALVRPDGGWSRMDIAAWLRAHADAQSDLLIGLDLSPALPFVDHGAYFPGWGDSPGSAKALWRLVDSLSARSDHLAATGFLDHPQPREHFRHHGYCGAAFGSGRGRLRECERQQAALGLNPSSCMNLVGAAQVGKSSLTGMRVLAGLSGRIPVWPFDPIPEHGPMIVEIYTSLAAREAGIRRGHSKVRDRQSLDAVLAALCSDAHQPLTHYDDHATDAILTTAWLRVASGRSHLWRPAAMTHVIAATEGWTFGVP